MYLKLSSRIEVSTLHCTSWKCACDMDTPVGSGLSFCCSLRTFLLNFFEDEPLLAENPCRFVLHPIQYPDVRFSLHGIISVARDMKGYIFFSALAVLQTCPCFVLDSI